MEASAFPPVASGSVSRLAASSCLDELCGQLARQSACKDQPGQGGAGPIPRRRNTNAGTLPGHKPVRPSVPRQAGSSGAGPAIGGQHSQRADLPLAAYARNFQARAASMSDGQDSRAGQCRPRRPWTSHTQAIVLSATPAARREQSVVLADRPSKDRSTKRRAHKAQTAEALGAGCTI